MKNLWLVGLIVLAIAAPVIAHEGAKHEGTKPVGAKPESSESASTTITGEVVDLGCYLAHEGRGAKHMDCAIKCINAGMPIGLLTSDGKLYLLTMDHDNPDPYNDLKSMAAKTVAVTGEVLERGGMKGLEAASFKPAPAPAAK